MTRIALIGAGSIAQAHVDAIRLAGGEPVGVCTRGDSGKMFAEKNGIPVHVTTPQELVEAARPDALFLLTQPEAYRDILKALQPYNLPTFIEKPLGNTVAEAEALRPYLPEKVFVGLNRRFYGNVQAVLPLLAEAEGPVMAQVVMPEREKDYAQYADESIRNHWDMLQGIHLVDLITYLAGPVETVLAQDHWGDLPYTTTPRYTTVLYKTTRNHRVSFLSNFDSPGGWRIHFFLPKQEIIIAPLEKTAVKAMTGLEEIPQDPKDTNAKPGFLAQTECFLAGVRTSGPLPEQWVSFEDALVSMRSLEALFPVQQPALSK